MQRTPQTGLTQTKLTGFGIVQGAGSASASTTAPASAPDAGMEVDSATVRQPACQPITADFLLRALRENKEDIVKSLNANMNALALRVDKNCAAIEDNSVSTERNTADIIKQQDQIEKLTSRVQALEAPGPRESRVAVGRATLSADYMSARRSVRLWPVAATSEEELWGGVGSFLHDLMGIHVDDICQDDIEGIHRVEERVQPERIRDEVCVKFFDKKKRDIVFSNAPGLAAAVDGDGRPTAGLRLEIPPEMSDTFRLLSRFGTRLRARHGAGTKRHIKFDEFTGSMFVNIKLPGDTTWARVTAEMARQDLEMSLREEDSQHQRRLASKLVPGPRERLGRPLPSTSTGKSSGRPTVAGGDGSGKRPRWKVPDRFPADRFPAPGRPV